MSEEQKIEEPAAEAPKAEVKADKTADAKPVEQNHHPLVSNVMAKIPAFKAKVHSVIAAQAPVVKDKLVSALDKMAEHSDKAKDVEKEKAEKAQAKAEADKAKFEADKAKQAAALIEFQQAYQASSRILQTARELFQTLIDTI